MEVSSLLRSPVDGVISDIPDGTRQRGITHQHLYQSGLTPDIRAEFGCFDQVLDQLGHSGRHKRVTIWRELECSSDVARYDVEH